ncbi:polysaccharide pyruvyl transferase family protein [Dehalobacter sp. TeCB1]|uniref:polysaccharide pyruvyl transferase family protein n=1 Tax=Dehalobacter sp. TeCB1 TaxID=1843715 RepID=UPI00083B87BE|nr:polysaccharide pyruvyl transferase family protein [Dehalobacter sp. TeCB1]OCZ49440.1 hypothetical protein A7D23_03010 [Dehalobacter sp. TeCB1]
MEKKIKVGIITLVSTINYGTALQAFATQKVFEKMLGKKYVVEVLNFEIWDGKSTTETDRNNSFRNKLINTLHKLLRVRLNKIYSYNKMKRLMKEFVKNNINTSPYSYCPSYKESLDFLISRNYDVYVSGSDEIWANKPGKPYPNIYFIPPQLKGLKISVSSSANRGDISKLTEFQRQELTASLMNYDFISVRDENTRCFVSNFTNKKVNLLFDPTLLYDFPFRDFSNKKIINAKKNQKKIICLMISDKKIANEIIEKYAKEYLIVSIYVFHTKTCLLVPSPLEFAAIFRNFDLVITNFFHGTVFSIKNDTPFISIDKEEIYKTYESKIADLLRRLNLKDQYLTMWDNNGEEIFKLHDKVQEMLCLNSVSYSNARQQIKEACELQFEEIYNCIGSVYN